MPNEKAKLSIPDAENMTIKLLTATKGADMGIAVALRDGTIPGFDTTGITTRSGIDLEVMLTDLRGVVLHHMMLLIDRFQGTEGFGARITEFYERAHWLLAKEDMMQLAEVMLDELESGLRAQDEPSDEDLAAVERLLARFRAGTEGKQGGEA